MHTASEKTKKTSKYILIITIISVLLFLFTTPAFAAQANSADQTAAAEPSQSAEPGGAVISAAAPAATQRTARKTTSAKSQSDAIDTAEKIYYCGELYIFANSMVKTNYEITVIAAALKESVDNGALAKNASKLKSLTKSYNAVSEKYNSWVDVKADLEYFIDKIGTRTAYSKSNLQVAFKRTLATLKDAQKLLEAAQQYSKEPTNAAKNALIDSADGIISAAAESIEIISPSAQKALASYRSLFDAFVSQSGMQTEYKTWQTPVEE